MVKNQSLKRLKKFNLEMQDRKFQDFNLGMKFSIENGFFNLTPPWLQKNRAWDWNFRSRMKISSQEWKIQARMIFSCVWEWFFQAIEREWIFSIFGPSGWGVCAINRPKTVQKSRDNIPWKSFREVPVKNRGVSDYHWGQNYYIT